jgi:acetyl-CoA C-acetyltransferase
VLLASEEWAQAHDILVQAYFTEAQTAGVDYVHKREGLLMAPAYAMPTMLARAQRKLQDFDFYEIHEAFAARPVHAEGVGGPGALLRAPRPRAAARGDRP